MPGQIAHDPGHAFIQQRAQFDPFDRQPVHRPGHLARQAQQTRGLGSLLAHLGGDQFGQPQPAPRRIGRGRHLGPGAQRIEQRPQRFVQIKVAHHRHARQQHASARQPDKRLGHDPLCAAGGKQQGQPGQAEVRIRIARDQPRHQRVGKAPVRGDRIDLQGATISHR